MDQQPGKISDPPLAGAGFLGWLGRQIGYVSKALRTEVGAPPAVGSPAAGEADPAATTIYRNDRVEEAPHPTEPGVVLRRTVMDEVIVRPIERATEKRETEQPNKPTW